MSNVKSTGRRMTKQGIFNFVYKFITKQGKPSMQYSRCMYRAIDRNGKILACAAGCLLDDSEAKGLDQVKIGGYTASAWLDVVRVGRAPERFKGFEGFIQKLQGIHDGLVDSCNFVQAFQIEMRHFAKRHNLTVPVV
ncbi:MAG: hypothetical protein JWO15_3535 [Sphingomonadales bacterium]|nr:hypothetical protein [Sphingomonadales bacterium]